MKTKIDQIAESRIYLAKNIYSNEENIEILTEYIIDNIKNNHGTGGQSINIDDIYIDNIENKISFSTDTNDNDTIRMCIEDAFYRFFNQIKFNIENMNINELYNMTVFNINNNVSTIILL